MDDCAVPEDHLNVLAIQAVHAIDQVSKLSFDAFITDPVVSQNSAWLDVHRSVRFGSRPLCSLFGRDSTISRLLLIDGLRPRSSFGTPRGAESGIAP